MLTHIHFIVCVYVYIHTLLQKGRDEKEENLCFVFYNFYNITFALFWVNNCYREIGTFYSYYLEQFWVLKDKMQSNLYFLCIYKLVDLIQRSIILRPSSKNCWSQNIKVLFVD